MVTDSGDLVVLAVQRAGEDARARRDRARARATCCCCSGTWAALDEQLEDAGVLVVDAPAAVRRQAVPLGPGAKRAIAVLAAMVVLLVTGAVPAAVAGLLAASAHRPARAAEHRPGLPQRLVDHGRAGRRHDLALDGDGRDRRRRRTSPTGSWTSSPTPARTRCSLALFLLTAALGQLISNMATALIVIPIALSAAADMDVAAEARPDDRRGRRPPRRSSRRSPRRRT